MRFLNVFLLMVSISLTGYAQAVIKIPVALNDAWSKNSYKHITKNNKQIVLHQGAQKLVTARIKKLMKEQNRELYVINPIFLRKKNILRDFILLRSKQYIDTKYPLANYNILPGSPRSIKNGVIRLRFMRKFTSEHKKLGEYLTPNNYMSEGKRVYLTLDLLEKVINIATAHEDY